LARPRYSDRQHRHGRADHRCGELGERSSLQRPRVREHRRGHRPKHPPCRAHRPRSAPGATGATGAIHPRAATANSLSGRHAESSILGHRAAGPVHLHLRCHLPASGERLRARPGNQKLHSLRPCSKSRARTLLRRHLANGDDAVADRN
ncbi:unnamed protein product, partial [Symbiodinium sp. KB8]